MILTMHRRARASELPAAAGAWDLAFVGPVVDERGLAALDYARTFAGTIHELQFDVDVNEVRVDGQTAGADSIEDMVAGRRVLLEATTLGFVEVFQSARACRNRPSVCLDILYAEPSEYQTLERSLPLSGREFSLTDEVRPFSGVPGATLLLRPEVPTEVAFFLGYEGQRLAQVMEQTSIDPKRCTVIFGVPAFQPGWEMNSFANNIAVLREHRIERILYAGAQNPKAAYDALSRIRDASPDARLLVGPVGTKPHGLATALFACEHANVGLIYDHPVRQSKRSRKIASWHLYGVQFG